MEIDSWDKNNWDNLGVRLLSKELGSYIFNIQIYIITRGCWKAADALLDKV